MPDQKISQLTAATTPLAGTEVLPIVQSGSTKQVSIANVTAGRSVAVGATVSSPRTFSVGGSVAFERFNATPTVAIRGGTDATVGYEYRLNVTQADGLTISSAVIGAGQATYYLFQPSGTFRIVAGSLEISTVGQGIVFSGNLVWRTGAGSPEGVVTAPVGSLYTRSDGGANTTLYVKESGAGDTGWVAK